MKIAILSCFYPFRGGISQFNACVWGELRGEHDVKAFNFKRQYPGLLFPGKTQFVTDNDSALPVDSVQVLDTINPFSYASTAKAIREWGPDLVLTRYWMSFFAPSLGYVTRRLRTTCKVISIVDNVTPHEKRFFDDPLTKYFLKGSDGHVVMSQTVAKDLLRLSPDANYITLQHPLYNNFGERIAREEAQKKLGLSAGKRNILFFGLIRDYKGLDILLRAFAGLGEDYQLIVAGEPYGPFDKYRKIIDEEIPGKDRVHLFTHYITDEEVCDFFSAADLVVLPYRDATQSGISSVSYHFEVPMVVTDVGGLKETIGDKGTGIVAPKCTPECIREEIVKYFSDPLTGRKCIENIRKEKEKMSWRNFCSAILDFSDKIEK